MNSVKRWPFAWLLFGLALQGYACNSAANTSATLDINSTITGGTCQVSVSNGGLIQLDTAPTHALENIRPDEYAPGGHDFSLTIVNCDVDLQQPGNGTLAIRFTPAVGAFVGDTQQVLPNETSPAQGGAKNVGFAVFTASDPAAMRNVERANGGGSSVAYPVNNASLLNSTYPFYVRYQKIKAAEAMSGGLVYSQALIEVSYD